MEDTIIDCIDREVKEFEDFINSSIYFKNKNINLERETYTSFNNHYKHPQRVFNLYFRRYKDPYTDDLYRVFRYQAYRSEDKIKFISSLLL